MRERPGMYIGSTDARGLHHLVWEIVDNGIDEVLAGFGNNITVTVKEDNSIVVEDDARSLSRHHAEIQVTDKGIFVTDLNSSNGTFVNQTKIVQQKLNHDDLVQFGSVIFRLVDETKSGDFHPDFHPVNVPLVPNSGLSILMRVSPEKSRVNMQDLLKQQKSAPTGSVLMIQGNDDSQRTSAKLRVLLDSDS